MTAAIGLLWAAAAAAQTAAPQAPPSPLSPAALAARSGDGRYFIAATGGVAAVQKVGGGASGELGVHLSNRLDIYGEGQFMQNVATRRRIDLAATVASALQTSQGKPASSTIEAAAFYGGGAVRVFVTAPGHVRPYFTAGGGAARVVLKPTFLLGGADVTANLPQFGVTLGSDLTGELTAPAYTGGFGVQVQQGRWYADVSARITSIQTEGQATNVKRASGGIGVRF
jgi:hypothetical protein